jgi:hypothetical protein
MNGEIDKPEPGLLEYVRSLENQSNRTRGLRVQLALRSMGIEPTIQECRLLKITNIIVDLAPGFKGKRLLFSAHYDAVKGSPGANDNASGVAVLLGLCRELNNAGIPTRIVFFDREEAWFRTLWLRLGLLGSLNYVLRNKVNNITAVYNLEFCGRGDVLGVWPVKRREKDLPAVKRVVKVADKLRLDVQCAHIPWILLSSDHLSFRLRGTANAVTLTLLPASQIPVMRNMISSLSVPKLLLKRKAVLPEPLSLIHTDRDSSSQVNEKSLKLILSVLLEIAKEQETGAS